MDCFPSPFIRSGWLDLHEFSADDLGLASEVAAAGEREALPPRLSVNTDNTASARVAEKPGPDDLYHRCMAYDQELAVRIRQLIGSDPDLAEKKMFGGLAFLIRGNMAIAAASQGGAMVRVDRAESDSLVKETAATVVEMRSRQMPGWLHVRSEDLRTDDQLSRWVQAGTDYARSLPAK